MLKNSYLLLLTCFFATLCNAADPFRGQGLSPETTESLARLLTAGATPSSSNTPLPAEGPSWWAQITDFSGNIVTNLTSPAGKEFVGTAQKAGNDLIGKLNTETIPEIKQNAMEIINHGETAVQHAVDYTAAAVQQNLNASTTHAATELKAIAKATLLSLCWVGLTVCGAKLICDGIEEHTGELKSKPTLKIGIGASCIALALYAVCRHFA